MPTEPSAEDRFVEAMRRLNWEHGPSVKKTGDPWPILEDVRIAIEAFADAVCVSSGAHWISDQDREDWEAHAICRARLLKRTFH